MSIIYTPSHFAVEDRALICAVMREHPFATLLSTADAMPVITHLPLQFEQRRDALVLIGHMARANPHWQGWADDPKIWAIFHGPSAYVSPSAYTTQLAVPTWNYIVVHAQGTVRVLPESAEKEDVLKRLIDEHDAAYREQWDQLSIDYREKMKGGIVAFEILVDRLEAKFKLSQNRSVADQAGVLRTMQAGAHQEQQLADWMQRLGMGRE